MSNFQLRDGRVLSNYGKPYYVAEVNTSHNGDLEVAKAMIDAAVDAGCSCVKFQSWSAETLYSKTHYKENPIAKRIVTKLSFGEKELLEVAEYCKSKNIDFASTPYSKSEVDFLINECNVPYIKVASMDINNYPFLEYIAKSMAPIVLSTGMSEIEEVRKAIEIINENGNTNICLLHCISIYPPETSTIHLNNLIGLREEFPNCTIGFSDHSIGVEMAIASIAMGAALIEKHLTLDKKKIGMDNQMATEPDEMKYMVDCCNNVYTALGSKTRVVRNAEKEQLLKMRRSIVLSKDLEAGTILTIDDLDAKRPGTGIAVDRIYSVVGKTLKCDKEADTILMENEIE